MAGMYAPISLNQSRILSHEIIIYLVIYCCLWTILPTKFQSMGPDATDQVAANCGPNLALHQFLKYYLNIARLVITYYLWLLSCYKSKVE